MATPDTRDAIAAALAGGQGLDAIEGIKTAVAREFEALDPGATIRTTDYFNHSYVPDMVVEWSDGGSTQERPVFLRFTLRATLIGQDVSVLSSGGPIVLTLKEEDADREVRETVRPAVNASPRLLLTDIPALDKAAAAREEDASRVASPLLDLLRPNIVRGARGILDATVVGDLTEAAAPVAGSDVSAPESLDRFEALVSDLFVEDAALRLRRSAEILRIGLSGNADQILRGDSSASTVDLSGRLTSAELATLIPYLLSRPDVTRSAAFWSQVGSMMDLARLEEMAGSLSGLDLTPLISANIDQWRASRAYLTSVAEGEELTPGSSDAGWRLRSAMLCLAMSNWQLLLTAKGQRLRGRSSDGLQARWRELEPALDGFELKQLSLRGISRTVEVGTDGDGDVRGDVRTISESIPDEFFVPRAHIRERESPDSSAIDVDFPRMLAIAMPDASIRDLSRAALLILGHRYPPDMGEFDRILG